MSSVNVTNVRQTADLVTFSEAILIGKLHFYEQCFYLISSSTSRLFAFDCCLLGKKIIFLNIFQKPIKAHTSVKSNCSQMHYKIVVPRSFAQFTKKYLLEWLESHFNTAAKKRLQHWCFHVNCANF